jgi:hypothetical protein
MLIHSAFFFLLRSGFRVNPIYLNMSVKKPITREEELLQIISSRQIRSRLQRGEGKRGEALIHDV